MNKKNHLDGRFALGTECATDSGVILGVMPKITKTMQHFSLAILAALTIGCGQPNKVPSGGASNGALDQEQEKIMEIARNAFAENDTWLDQAEFQTPKRNDDGSWGVGVLRVPEELGGHRVILIDQNGKVTNYIRGR